MLYQLSYSRANFELSRNRDTTFPKGLERSTDGSWGMLALNLATR